MSGKAEGATIRVYLEALETDMNALNKSPQEALADIIQAADALAELSKRTERSLRNDDMLASCAKDSAILVDYS